MISLGIERGDRIAIMGDPCYEYFVADMAGLCVGAITYGIYTTCSPTEVRHQLENAGAKLFIAENQEYVDKVLELEDLDDRSAQDYRRLTCARCFSIATSAS